MKMSSTNVTLLGFQALVCWNQRSTHQLLLGLVVILTGSVFIWGGSASPLVSGKNTFRSQGDLPPLKSSIVFLTIDPNDPQIVYGATQNFGVIKSTDAGLTFEKKTNGFSEDDPFGEKASVQVTTVRVASMLTGNIFAAGYEGLFKSTDGAQSWQQITAAPSILTALAVDPGSPNLILTAQSNQFLRSTNEGKTFTTESTGLTQNKISVLEFDPKNPSVVFAGTGKGIFRSTDRGISWVESSQGLPDDRRILSLAISPSKPKILYAAGHGGLFQSRNAGQTWQVLNLGTEFNFDQEAAFSAVVHPTNPKVVFALTSLPGKNNQVNFTLNGGKSWNSFPVTEMPHSLTINKELNLLHIGLTFNPEIPNPVFTVRLNEEGTPIF